MINSIKPAKFQFALALLVFWLTATAFAFWWFQIKNLRPFDLNMSSLIEEKPLTTNIKHLLLSSGLKQPAKGYILNFWQPDCSCNRFNTPHVKKLIKKYQSEGFKLITVTRPSKKHSVQQVTQMAKDKFNSAVIVDTKNIFSGASRIPATPSAAVIQKNGLLNYFGPYNDGAFCGVGGTRFVEKVADLIIQNEPPNIINTLSYGCYCNWV